MPVYEYECLSCQSTFEVTRKFSETGGNACPKCGVEGRRVYCAPFLVFKGPGFYVTDYRTEVDPEIEHRKKEKEAAEKVEKASETKSPAVEGEKSKTPVTSEKSPTVNKES